MKKPLLAQIDPREHALGQPTIMERALAAEYGTNYVHLAAFVIDVDRFYALDPELGPFGWEVFLTEAYLLGRLDPGVEEQRSLLEQMCTLIMDAPDREPRLGGQLAFAVYNAIERGALPRSLRPLFDGWCSAPRGLIEDLSALWAAPEDPLAAIAEQCLDRTLAPPAAPPTEDVLHEMALGDWDLGAGP